MNRFQDMDEALSAYVDGEVTEDERRHIASRIEDSSAVREAYHELLRVRSGLVAVFDDMQRQAPPAPFKEEQGFSRRRLAPWAASLVAAAAVIVGALFIFNPGQTPQAAPLDLLQRAASQFEDIRSVELWGRLESPGVTALVEAFSDGEKKGDRDRSWQLPMRVLLDGENRALIQVAGDPGTSWGDGVALFGWDGKQSWIWECGSDEVKISPDSLFGLEIGDGHLDEEQLDLGGQRLIDFLSWGFVERLRGADENLSMREVTWPTDKRAGRRVFEMLSEDEDGKKGLAFSRTLITIDEKSELIERVVFEVNLAGFSLLKATLEVAEVDPASAAGLFDYGSHAPADARIVR